MAAPRNVGTLWVPSGKSVTYGPLRTNTTFKIQCWDFRTGTPKLRTCATAEECQTQSNWIDWPVPNIEQSNFKGYEAVLGPDDHFIAFYGAGGDGYCAIYDETAKP
jgi:hypothetical protein